MEWISVKSKKKPIRGENVLVCSTDGDWVVSAYWTGKRWFNQFEFPENGDVKITPTHWMPFPKPPQNNKK